MSERKTMTDARRHFLGRLSDNRKIGGLLCLCSVVGALVPSLLWLVVAVSTGVSSLTRY